MQLLGHVQVDAEFGGAGRHPHARHSFGGCGFVQKHSFNSPDDLPGFGQQWYSLMLAVPESLHERVVETRPRTRLTLTLVPWSRTSGFGLLVLLVDGGGRAAGDAVVAILDIAGRKDLDELEEAERRGRLTVGLASAADPSITPLEPVVGFSEALADARFLRRLAVQELAECVEEVRSILRGPAARVLLGASDTRFDTLCVNVCRLT